MLIQLTAPSKTFILGEYLALHDGVSLLVSTRPRFTLSVYPADKAMITGIHPDSPTYKLCSDHQNLLRCYQIDFHDPHDQKKGLGASSAQFLMFYMLIKYVGGEKIENQPTSFINHMIDEYRHYSFQPKSMPPSGSDLIAQFYGAMTFCDKENSVYQSYAWPFPNIGLYLLHTGMKISTHSHLQTLSIFPHQALKSCLAPLHQQIQDGNEQEFINTVNQYGQLLENLGFVIDQTQSLLDQIRSLDGVVAAKGCGAMGADIILVMVYKSQKEDFLEWVNAHDMEVVADEYVIDSGLSIKQFAMPKAV